MINILIRMSEDGYLKKHNETGKDKERIMRIDMMKKEQQTWVTNEGDEKVRFFSVLNLP